MSSSKVAEVTLFFWIIKICATTLGETAGDLFSMTLNLGYGASSMLLLTLFIMILIVQLSAKSFHPLLYWGVVLATSTAGTTMSDFMDRSLGFGYLTGSLVLALCLTATLSIWRVIEKSLSITAIKTTRVEIFYWTAILFSNTLGTAVGDCLADDSGLGFMCSAMLIGGLIGLVVLTYWLTAINRVLLFWIAFVLTRPFGATLGDLLSKPASTGGLNLGTVNASLILAVLMFSFIAVSYLQAAGTASTRDS